MKPREGRNYGRKKTRSITSHVAVLVGWNRSRVVPFKMPSLILAKCPVSNRPVYSPFVPSSQVMVRIMLSPLTVPDASVLRTLPFECVQNALSRSPSCFMLTSTTDPFDCVICHRPARFTTGAIDADEIATV